MPRSAQRAHDLTQRGLARILQVASRQENLQFVDCPISDARSDSFSRQVIPSIVLLLVVPALIFIHAIGIYYASMWARIVSAFYREMLWDWLGPVEPAWCLWPYRIFTFPWFCGFGVGVAGYVGLGPAGLLLVSLFMSVHWTVRVYRRTLKI
jgi:hypothetical protein